MKTNVSVKLVGNYLRKHGWAKYQIVEDERSRARVLTGWTEMPAGDSYIMLITLNKAANVMLFAVPEVAKAPKEEIPAGHLADILMALGFINYSLMLGRFSYDTRDGEIRFEYALPYDNASVSFEQFDHVINAITSTLAYWNERVKDVVGARRTGESIVESFLDKANEFRRGWSH